MSAGEEDKAEVDGEEVVAEGKGGGGATRGMPWPWSPPPTACSPALLALTSPRANHLHYPQGCKGSVNCISRAARLSGGPTAVFGRLPRIDDAEAGFPTACLPPHLLGHGKGVVKKDPGPGEAWTWRPRPRQP